MKRNITAKHVRYSSRLEEAEEKSEATYWSKLIATLVSWWRLPDTTQEDAVQAESIHRLILEKPVFEVVFSAIRYRRWGLFLSAIECARDITQGSGLVHPIGFDKSV
jgi:hypothetical protein